MTVHPGDTLPGRLRQRPGTPWTLASCQCLADKFNGCGGVFDANHDARVVLVLQADDHRLFRIVNVPKRPFAVPEIASCRYHTRDARPGQFQPMKPPRGFRGVLIDSSYMLERNLHGVLEGKNLRPISTMATSALTGRAGVELGPTTPRVRRD